MNAKKLGIAVWFSAAVLSVLSASAFTYGEIDNRTAPGTVLDDGGYYYVRRPTTIDASDLPGQSALKVPVGASVVIEIEAGATLSVFGGNGVGQMPGGAGIEVPSGSKLAVCGAGLLYAQGGSAANGVAGYAGEDALSQVLVDVKRDSTEDEWRRTLGEEPEEEPQFTEDDLVPIFCGRCGEGGAGGAGGGGAGAGIGGKGGRGGLGGAGGDSRTIVKEGDWTAHQRTYEWWFGLLNWTNSIYRYDYYDLSPSQMKLCADGLPGTAGMDGAPGEGCGQIVIGEYVQVLAFAGGTGSGGACGRRGSSFDMFDSDYDEPTTLEYIIGGLHVFSKVFAAEEDEEDGKKEKEEKEEPPDYTEKKLWFYGGGGGGGGAGGAAAADGIGPGGAGGGGGGGGGSGLFAIGPTCGDNEVNGEGGKGGAGYDLEELGLSTSGTDADAESDGESAHVAYKDKDGDTHDDYNDINGRLTTACLMNGDRRAYAGQGGSGGAAAEAKPAVSIRGSENAIIIGIEEKNIVSFSGDMSYEYTFDDCDGQPPTKNILICGKHVTPLSAIPVGEGDKTGKFFNGYYTEPNGQGTRYFDASGFPNTDLEIWSAGTLYAYWTDSIGANQRLVNLRWNGETRFSFVVELGGRLPALTVKTLQNVKGWTCVGAYRMVGNEQEFWYDEDGSPLLDTFPGNENVDLELLFEPKWDMMAEAPENGASFTYNGEGQRVAHTGEQWDYEIVGGTVVATNVGVYSTTVRFRRARNEDGSEGEPLFEIWDDTLSTDDVREIKWRITKAVIEGVSLANTVYDWTQTNNMFRFEGAIPKGVEVEYELLRFLDRSAVEVKATLKGGNNYYDKELISTLTVPQAVYVTSLRPHYPWNTTFEVDFGFVPELFEGIYKVHKYIYPVVVTEGAQSYGDEHYHVLSNSAVRIEQMFRGGGTLSFDPKEAVGDGFRGKVWAFLAIDEMPASFSTEIFVDSTAETVEGVPVYSVAAAGEISPINFSWRYEPDLFKKNSFAEVRLTFDSGAGDPLTFAPVGVLGRMINEGEVRWTPPADGTYDLSVSVFSEPEADPVVKRARFVVSYAAGEPKLPTVARVGSKDYTSLSAAIAGIRDSGTNEVIVVGDVQAEKVAVPDGVTVTFGLGGVFDAKRMLGDNYHKMTPVYNSLYELTGWQYALDPGQVTPVIADFELSTGGASLTVSNVKPGLIYTLQKAAQLDGDWQSVESKVATKVDQSLVFAVEPSQEQFFRVIVSEGSR